MKGRGAGGTPPLPSVWSRMAFNAAPSTACRVAGPLCSRQSGCNSRSPIMARDLALDTLGLCRRMMVRWRLDTPKRLTRACCSKSSESVQAAFVNIARRMDPAYVIGGTPAPSSGDGEHGTSWSDRIQGAQPTSSWKTVRVFISATFATYTRNGSSCRTSQISERVILLKVLTV